MQSKTISVSKQHKRTNFSATLLLASKLVISIVPVLQGCASTQPVIRSPVVIERETLDTEPHYISEEVYRQLRYSGLEILGIGPERVIMEVQSEVENIRSLYRSSAYSFATVNMPKDMQRLLKKYQTNDEYGDYYNYIITNLDRVVLCPNLYLGNYHMFGQGTYGIAMAGDDLIYPGENTVYVNTFYGTSYRDHLVRWIATTIHETGHIQLIRMVESGKLPADYLLDSLQERYASIRQIAFLRSAAADKELYAVRDLLEWHIAQVERVIESCNSVLGLSPDDRTLFPR